MTRESAYQTLTVYTQSQSLIRHHLAVEAAMRALAVSFSQQTNIPQNEEEWGITGLLHDADYELTRKNPEKHTLYLEEKMKDQIPPHIMHAIKAHNYAYTKIEPKTPMDWALYTCDELTGFIVYCALKLSDKKLTDLNADIVFQKLQDASFAENVPRAQIYQCEKSLGIPIKNFIQIVLSSMQAIDSKLGLSVQ